VAFAFGTGDVEPDWVRLPEMASSAVAEAIRRGVRAATASRVIRPRARWPHDADAAGGGSGRRDVPTVPARRDPDQVVFGVGAPDADLMFIGEAPGFHEDKQGEPFVGAAGQLLTRMLGEIGLRREDVYIANVLKCRPPATATRCPTRSRRARRGWSSRSRSSSRCWSATLGNFATKFVLNTSQGITRLRGQTFPWHGRTVVPTFHPAAILRSGATAPSSSNCSARTFVLIGRTLEELHETPPAATEASDPAGGETAAGEEQLELF